MIAELSELVDAAKRNDPGAVPKIRTLLDENPDVWKHYGDLSSHVEARWIELLAGDDECVRESLVRRVDELRQEILDAGQNTPLERLLTERVVISWLMTRFFDAAVAEGVMGSRASHVRYLQQQLDKSQRRHSAGIKALAELRKLLP